MDDPDLEHKIHQQQYMIEQQRQEELMRLQQVALAEKHREERHHHMMMQHEDERFRGMQQEVAMRHKLPHPHDGPPPPHPMQQPPPPHPPPPPMQQPPPHPLDGPPPPHPMQQPPPPHPHDGPPPPHPMQQPPPPHPLEHQMPPPPPHPPLEHQMPHELQHQHMRRPPPTGPPPGPMPPPPPPPHMHPHLHGPPPPIGMMPPGVEDDEDRGGKGGVGGDMDGGPLSGTSPPRPLMSLNVQPPPAMLAALGGPGGGEGSEGGMGVPGDQEQAAAGGGGAAQDGAREVRLPMALEQALAFKTERAKQVGVRPEEIEGGSDKGVMEEPPHAPPLMPSVQTQKAMDAIYALAGDEDDDEDEEEGEDRRRPKGKGAVDSGGEEADGEKQQRQSKNNRKKRRKKKAKERQRAEIEAKKKGEGEAKEAEEGADDDKKKKSAEPDVEVEYIQETLGMNEHDPLFRQFAHIFETFRIADNEKGNEIEADKEAESRPAPPKEMDLKKVPKMDVDDSDDEGNDAEEEKKNDGEKSKLSKRKLKRLTRLSVAELKQLVSRPDVVEMHDVTARDPKLLVQLKAHRNTVAVPRHWCFKRKYLQGKRGIEKPPFDLPDFIKRTGIMEMRAALQEKEDQRTLKAKMRERARPKLGKIDIDYQKLHDAFFKWQTKPRMTIHGDLYYEGKEFETRLREKKPGELTEELRTALGMPVGPSAHKVPPPWLIAMQRYGPPPSYPNLKIAGLNAPIPDGCSFGYHAGGWGKPPVDESGRPLYGDVFGTQTQDYSLPVPEEDIDHTMWGELESESEEESEEEEDEEEEEEGVDGVGTDGQEDGTGLVTPAEGLITPSGITSIPAGMETPEIIELRKRKIESDMEGGETPALYQVLPEKRLDRLGGAAMMASTHIYDMTGAGGPPPGVPPPPPPSRRLGTGAEAMGVGGPGTVELALDPSELDLVDTEAMAQRYEQTLREQQSQLQKEDLSDMLVEHVARQKNKRKRQQHQENKQAKKYKEFKF